MGDTKDGKGTGGLRCPKCGTPYPDITGIRYDLVYGASDALRLGCRCPKCDAKFHEWWLITPVGNEMQLSYIDTDES